MSLPQGFTEKFLIATLALLLACAGRASAADIIAASPALADVQAAVNAASDGDTVLIPNGSATWSSGLNTSKQIIIRAQNYTPTPGGTSTRNVTITHNATSSPLITLQSGNNFHCGVGGISFRRGTSDRAVLRLTGSGSKPPLVFDCFFEDRGGAGNSSAEEVNVIAWLSLGGVAWNIRMDGSSFPDSSVDRGVNVAKASIHFKSPRAWTTASTMGALDANGNVNVYIEDSTFVNAGTGDIDDNGRVVLRYSTFNGTRWITHGFTSMWGGRHWESYNNTYSVATSPRNMAGSYFWCRAGTGVFTDNVVNNAASPSDYGNMALLSIGDNTNPSAYLQNRQMGGGHDGTRYVSDPIYIWNNSGARATAWSVDSTWSNNVQLNRDIFVNSGAKPGYSKYTYPHPMRSAISAPGPVQPPDGGAPTLQLGP